MAHVRTLRLARALRNALLGTSALVTLPAAGQTIESPTGGYREAQSIAVTGGNRIDIAGAVLESQAAALKVDPVQPDPQIVIANPNTPTTARDPVNVTGIGQMVVDTGGGFIGLCTGTLINPRTVIFAAHCVNEEAATAYGANSGGTPIGFGFETNTRANAAGQTDELLRWLIGGTNGAGKYQTNVAQSFYNANFVTYNPYSLEPAANSFLYGDVALATLDTPAANVPTWALMFSPLPAPGSINAATGTGYNVNLVGYGNNGTGQTGAAGIDYRRRSAENILGALTDLQTFEGFLFGGPSNGLTQNLYFLDFDDPRRGMSGASPFDFNAFRDNAVASGKEGITSSGDSGGPLIVTNFSKQLVIGVLSGGYTRFFAAQPANGYGTVSFYQPLYLYWDWISANNPYHYVTAKSGDGSWTDPAHWVSTLDPAYNILVGGQVVNGVPALPGQQKFGTSGDFGQICYQAGGVSDCYDTNTGTEAIERKPIGTDATEPAPGTASSQPATDKVASGTGKFDGVARESQAGPDGTGTALPAATIANGLPGATNFVPSNSDPVRVTGTQGRYFDVTLANAGTTTLSGANITIDRLTLGTTGAQLVIANGASLTTLINTTQFAGFMTVNGTLNSVGDYSVMAGGLLGTGRINAPFVNSVMGQIAPGSTSTIGTLTIGGNLMLASASTYMVNLGGNGQSDTLAVVANDGTGGMAQLGGRVIFSPTTGATVRYNDLYTILTAQNGLTGTFATPSALSAILMPTFVYSANTVQARIAAGTYASVVQNTPVQRAYAQLLDRNRATNYAALSSLYGPLDLQNAATIQTTLEGLAPRVEAAKRGIGTVALDNMTRFYRERVSQMDPVAGMDGTLALSSAPLQLAALSTSSMPVTPGAQVMASDSAQTVVRPGVLPEAVNAFVAGGYLDGSSRAQPSLVPASGRNQFDGWYAAAGIEAETSENSALGFGFSYTDANGDTMSGQRAVGKLYLMTLYGKVESSAGLFLDTQVSAGIYQAETRRNVNFLGTNYDLRARDNTLAISTEVGVGKKLALGTLSVAPRIAARASQIEYTPTAERGGPVALVYDRQTVTSVQGRAGLVLSGGMRVKPYVSAYYVHEFRDQPGFFGANFAGGVGPSAIFALPGYDRDWAEVAGGISVGSERVSLSLSADTTFERTDVRNQSYRATASIRF